MYRKLNQQKEGFTIIEVLIVLAIAGLIMLIVFLAVPALQRNSRNNSRRNDASRALASAAEWRTTHSNLMPAGDVDDGAKSANETDVNNLAGDLNFFDSVEIRARTGSNDNLAGATWISTNNVYVVTNANCASTTSKSSGNGLVAVFKIETGSGLTETCISS